MINISISSIPRTQIKKGFTLLEMIIYLAITMLMMVSVVSISQNLIFASVKTKTQSELSSAVRLVMSQIVQKTRNATDVITGSSVFNLSPGTLILDYPGGGTDVIFDTYTKDITAYGVNLTIRKLRMKDGAAPYVDLTSDNINVTNFIVRNLTRGTEPKNINIELTINQLNPGNNPNYNSSFNLETAVSLRK